MAVDRNIIDVNVALVVSVLRVGKHRVTGGIISLIVVSQPDLTVACREIQHLTETDIQLLRQEGEDFARRCLLRKRELGKPALVLLRCIRRRKRHKAVGHFDRRTDGGTVIPSCVGIIEKHVDTVIAADRFCDHRVLLRRDDSHAFLVNSAESTRLRNEKSFPQRNYRSLCGNYGGRRHIRGTHKKIGR